MNFLWDLHQHHQIGRLKGQAASAESQTKNLGVDLDRVVERIDRLVLINNAMWELLAERTQLAEGDLVDKIREIDLRDGVEDGKLRMVLKCPKCARMMSQRHGRCLYCGEESLETTPFDGVRGEL